MLRKTAPGRKVLPENTGIGNNTGDLSGFARGLWAPRAYWVEEPGVAFVEPDSA